MMILIDEKNLTTVENICQHDPVRPNIPCEWRIANGNKVFFKGVKSFDMRYITEMSAACCISFKNTVPKSEMEMVSSVHFGNIAIFYTVWSTKKGAGREIIFNIVDYLKEHKPNVKRYVTLSPKTEMAKKFHLRNGAEWIAENETTNNFEYFV
tara:strand:+ start:74 stop:532 length:459 start_codon:yes stop_codon:yes gene_type:complete